MIGPLRATFRRIWSNPSGRAGLVAFALLVAASTILPPFLPDPAAMPDPAAGALPPGPGHWLGTDLFNRDILSRLASGARVSLGVAAIAVGLSVTLGALVGLVAGALGGLVDGVLMRVVDGAMAVPRLFILLLLVVVWERVPLLALVLVIGGTGWFATARLVRAEVLRLGAEPFLLAARALGSGTTRLMVRHLLPNATGPLLVAATLGIGEVILLEAGLSFLGVGVQPPTPSWGGMILESKPILVTAPWTSLAPGIAIAGTVLAANLVGDAMRAAIDPRSA